MLRGGRKVKRNILLISIILFLLFLFPAFTMASTDEPILLDSPEILRNSLNKPYKLESVNLRLPDIKSSIFNERAQNKLQDLALLYGNEERNNIYNLLERDMTDQFSEYRLNVEEDVDGNIILLNPLPGVSLNAEFDINEEDYTLEENTNISLNYWMNNRTLIRAEYGRENREWWDIRDIRLDNNEKNEGIDYGRGSGEDDGANEKDDETDGHEDDNEDRIGNSDEKSFEEEYIKELILNEEKNETSRLGISYRTNDYLTISADYINDFTSLNRDYSTIFGLEYKDDLGSLRYHYQMDYGDDRGRETGLEFGYRDLATFNATYKIYDPKTIEEQISQLENQWDFGLDLNLNELSTLSFEYQKQGKLSENLFAEVEDDEGESNIKAKLEIKF